MTIADKLNYLNDTKQAIKQAITDKGVEVLKTDTFRSYADKIASIEAGGGTGAEYKSSLMATTTQSAYSPSIVSLSDYVLPDYTIEKGQTGFLYPKREKETNEYNSSNVEKIGSSISVSDSGFVSGFDFNNYLKFTHNLAEPIRNLDLIIKGRVSTSGTWQVGISVSGTSAKWAQWVKIYNSNKLGMLPIGEPDSGGFTVLNEVDYWFRCVGTENTFTLYCKRYDGLSVEETKNQEDWTQVFQTSLDKCIEQGINTFTFGRNDNPSYPSQYWRGGFDLKNFQFIINDEIVCGYNRRLRGICTKDFIPQVGTNTLNAYHIEYTDGTSECLLGQTEPTGEDIKNVQLLESGLTFEEDKAWTYNEDNEQFE